MTDNIDNIVLEHLKHIRKSLESLDEKVDMLTGRVSSIEQSTAFLHVDLAQVNSRLDSFSKRLERIERRLELSDSLP